MSSEALNRAGDAVTEQSAGPAQLVLMAGIARRYYLDGRSKIEIAEEFGLTRFKVARLLDAARDRGVVHIEIRHDGAAACRSESLGGRDVEVSGKDERVAWAKCAQAELMVDYPRQVGPRQLWRGRQRLKATGRVLELQR